MMFGCDKCNFTKMSDKYQINQYLDKKNYILKTK